MKSIYASFLLYFLSLHAMEKETIEKSNEKKSSVSSLKLLAAKAYAKKNKSLPEKSTIPDECLDPIKLYSQITPESVAEQYTLAIKFNDEKRKIACFNYVIKKNTSLTDSFFTFIELQLGDCSKIELYNTYYKKCKTNLDHQLKQINLSHSKDEYEFLYKRLKKQCNNNLSKCYNCCTLFTLCVVILPAFTLLCY